MKSSLGHWDNWRNEVSRPLFTLGRNLILALLLVCTWGPPCAAQIVDDRHPYFVKIHEVLDIFFLDSNHGWIILAEHDTNAFRLLRTDNGGETWERFKAPEGVFRICFITPKVGWLVSSQTEGDRIQPSFHLLHTSDGGRSWQEASSQPIIEASKDWVGAVTDFAFMDSKNGWFVGHGRFPAGLVMRTSDGGETVESVSDLSSSIRDCSGLFLSGRAGVWIYGQGFVVHSADQGKTWSRPLDLRELHTTERLMEMTSAFIWPNGRGWLAGMTSAGIVLGTEDSGKHWKTQLKPDTRLIFTSISSWDVNHLCAAANSTKLFCSSDGGLNWTDRDILPPPTQAQAEFFSKLIVLNSGRGWILRAGGYLYETKDFGDSWHELDPSEKSVKR